MAGIAVAVVVGGTVAVLVDGARRPRRPLEKARRLRRAVERMVDHPERVARRDPPAAERILAMIGTTAATLILKRVLARAMPRPAGPASP